jgi:hypothetical protein
MASTVWSEILAFLASQGSNFGYIGSMPFSFRAIIDVLLCSLHHRSVHYVMLLNSSGCFRLLAHVPVFYLPEDFAIAEYRHRDRLPTRRRKQWENFLPMSPRQ